MHYYFTNDMKRKHIRKTAFELAKELAVILSAKHVDRNEIKEIRQELSLRKTSHARVLSSFCSNYLDNTLD